MREIDCKIKQQKLDNLISNHDRDMKEYQEIANAEIAELELQLESMKVQIDETETEKKKNNDNYNVLLNEFHKRDKQIAEKKIQIDEICVQNMANAKSIQSLVAALNTAHDECQIIEKETEVNIEFKS